jgi:hypothetical protein
MGGTGEYGGKTGLENFAVATNVKKRKITIVKREEQCVFLFFLFEFAWKTAGTWSIFLVETLSAFTLNPPL